MSVSRTLVSALRVTNVVFTLQLTTETKTKIGVDGTFELINISHIVTEEDGSLKIKKMEDFVDSKSNIDIIKAYDAALAGK